VSLYTYKGTALASTIHARDVLGGRLPQVVDPDTKWN